MVSPKKQEIIVKRATIEDLAGLARLFNNYRIFYKQESNLDEAQKFLKGRITQNDSVIFVAFVENNYAGFTQLYPSFSSVSMQRLWILNDLYVSKSYRKQGVASSLMDKANTFAKQTASKGIVLETAKNNVQAKQLYEKIGYQKEENYDTYFFFLRKDKKC